MTDSNAFKSRAYLQRLLSLLEGKQRKFDSEIVRLTIEILFGEKNQTKRVYRNDHI
jgi:hypothetical protein